MFSYDSEASRRINAAELFAIGFAWSSAWSPGKDEPRKFQVDGARWFVMAKSPRLALREILQVHAGEIATSNANAVKETVFSEAGFPISGPNEGNLGDRILYVCRAQDLPGISVRWDPMNPGKVLGEDTYQMQVPLPYIQYNGNLAKEITFRFVRAS